MYEDDGISTNYENGDFSINKIIVQKGEKSIDINVKKYSGNYDEHFESFLFDIYDADSVKSVISDRRNIQDFQSSDDLTKEDEGVYFDIKNKLLTVKVKYTGDMKIHIE